MILSLKCYKTQKKSLSRYIIVPQPQKIIYLFKSICMIPVNSISTNLFNLLFYFNPNINTTYQIKILSLLFFIILQSWIPLKHIYTFWYYPFCFTVNCLFILPNLLSSIANVFKVVIYRFSHLTFFRYPSFFFQCSLIMSNMLWLYNDVNLPFRLKHSRQVP